MGFEYVMSIVGSGMRIQMGLLRIGSTKAPNQSRSLSFVGWVGLVVSGQYN